MSLGPSFWGQTTLQGSGHPHRPAAGAKWSLFAAAPQEPHWPRARALWKARGVQTMVGTATGSEMEIEVGSEMETGIGSELETGIGSE